MTTRELYDITNAIAPKVLSDEYCQKYGAYDNSGILIDAGEPIDKVVFSLDLSGGAVQRALREKANAIVMHHPAIYGSISAIRVDDGLGEKIVICIKNGISVIAMHLNLDGVNGGIDESLQDAILVATNTQTKPNTQIMHPLSQGGYGRAYDVHATALKTFCKDLGKTLGSERTLFYGDGEKKIKRVASFCGAGVDDETLAFAKAQGADVIVSSDYKHHFIARALEMGLAVVVLTHYSAEQYGFKKFYEKVSRQTDVTCDYHVDEVLL